jgi:transcriptional regulator with XRE-family HTH domain
MNGGEPKPDRDWFKERQRQVGLNQSDLARFMRSDPAAITNLFKSGSGASIRRVVWLAELLKVTPHEIIERLGYAIKNVGIEVKGRITADCQFSHVSERIGERLRYLGHPDEAAAAVFDTANAPITSPMVAYSEGAVVYLPSPDRTVHVGHLCIVESAEHTLPIFGTIHRSDRQGAHPVALFDGSGVIPCGKIIHSHRVLAIYTR